LFVYVIDWSRRL